MKKELTASQILEKLMWYHGRDFNTNILNDDFLKDLEKEKKNQF